LNLLRTKNLDYADDNLNQFVLPMAKSDIANYLGMQPESISRALRQLESQGLVKNNTNGKLTIINKEKILSEVMKISA
jgi:Mn-dependent DtxR family transcriptional regulator